MRYEWFIAKRYLRPLGGATFIFHLTLISMAAVALGVASLIVVLSVMNGFGDYLRSIILEVRSHVVIRYPSGVSNYDQLLDNFSNIDNVEAVSPVIMDYGFLTTRGQQTAVVFLGIDPKQETEVTGLGQHVFLGDPDQLAPQAAPASATGAVSIFELEERAQEQPLKIFLGKELGRNLFGIYESEDLSMQENYEPYIGERVRILAIPKGRGSPTLSAANSSIFTVAGFFETGHYEYDSSMAYISIPAAQHLLNLPGQVNRLQFRLADHSPEATNQTVNDIIEVNQQISTARGLIDTWQSMNQNFFNALEIEKLTMNIILRIIILVATFNIIATLFMVVTEKTRDIGLLRALGAGRRNVMMIFMGLGVLIGALGAIAGAGIGYGICTFIQTYPIELPGDGGIYYLKYLPCVMKPADFFWATLYTFLVSFLASIYPSLRAARFMIVDALRFS